MTPSTTNTAARELLASALDECGRPTDAAEVREGRNPLVRGEYALTAIEKALTQQQGGEQEGDAYLDKLCHVVHALTGDEGEDDPLTVLERYAANGATLAYPDEDNTKQPAASEGDGRLDMLRECYEWLFESKADGPRVSEGAIARGDYTPAFRDLHERLSGVIANTSKQAAGEAVAEVCSGWALRWIGTEPLAKICARHPDLRIGSLLYTTPPRHPADEELSKSDKDYILRTQNLLLGFMLDCNAIGAKEAGVNLARSMKEKAALQAGTP